MRVSLMVGSFLGAVGLLVAACGSSSNDTVNAPIDNDAGVTLASDEVFFYEHIEPIVAEHCQNCHHAGGVAPFALVTYADVKARGVQARSKVEAKDMPPWGAFNSDECNVSRPIVDDIRLSDEQIALFLKWVDTGMKEGDPAKALPSRTFGDGKLEGATNTYSIASPYNVPAAGKDEIRCFPIDPKLPSGSWITGSNVIAGDSRVVHHAIVFTDPKGEAAGKVDASGSYPCFGDPGTSDPSVLLAWAPGAPPLEYGKNAAVKVADGMHLVLQIHYHPTTVAVQDQTQFELRVSQTRPQYVTELALIGNADGSEDKDAALRLLPGPDDPATGPAFVIPANATAHTETMELVMPTTISGFPTPELRIGAAGAHMHWAGTDMTITIERAKTTSEPQKECLIGTPKYNFNWQRGYAYNVDYDQLPTLNGGDKITLKCTYNNSLSNPFVQRALQEMQMSEPQPIKLGETTLDEMCLGVFGLLRPITPID